MRVASAAVKGGIRERREELKSLLKEVIVKAHQLGLNADEVLNLLRPMLDDLSEKHNLSREDLDEISRLREESRNSAKGREEGKR